MKEELISAALAALVAIAPLVIARLVNEGLKHAERFAYRTKTKLDDDAVAYVKTKTQVIVDFLNKLVARR